MAGNSRRDLGVVIAVTTLTRTLKLGMVGADVEACKRAVYRYVHAGASWNTFVRSAPIVRRTFGVFFREAVKVAQLRLGLKADGQIGPATEKALRKAGGFDLLADSLLEQYAAAHVATIGPVVRGEPSILSHDCTHATDGIPLYPAFDTAFRQGASIIAPEGLTVTRPSSSRPGQAFYATGQSGMRYWFGHLDRTHAAGVKFGKGASVGRVAPNHVGGGPHCHVGVNVEKLWGPGRELVHHRDYTHGAPTIGHQLRLRSLL